MTDILSLKRRIFKTIEDRKNQLFDCCSDLIRMKSENPPGDTAQVASFIIDYLNKSGKTPKIFEPQKGIFNIISSIGKSKPWLVMNGHLDTFPAGTKWQDNPFSGKKADKKIYGRGAIDMKGGVAASLFAFLIIDELIDDLPGKISLCLVSDEESGGKWGTEWILKNTELKSADACLIGEPGGIDVIGVGEKGKCCFRIETIGITAHGAYDTLGENAIIKMCRLIPLLDSLKGIRSQLPAEIEDLIEKEKPYVESEYGAGTGDVLTRVSVNVGCISGGTMPNLVPDACRIDVDTRIPLLVTPKDVLERLGEELRREKLDDSVVTPSSVIEPTYTSVQNQLVKTLEENVAGITGKEPLCVVKIGATDARFFRKIEIPTVTFGPGIYNMGKPNEYIPLDELVIITKVYAATAVDYLLSSFKS